MLPRRRQAIQHAALAASAALGAVPAHAETLPATILDNRIFLPVTLNKQGPFPFLLDTGSSSTTLNKPLEKILALRPLGGATGTGAGEQKIAFDTIHLSEVAAGNIQLGAMDVPAMDTGALTRAIGFPDWGGVLGVEIFRHNAVTIDASHQRVTIVPTASYTPPPDATRIPIALTADGTPIATATVNGITAKFEIDTGDRSSLTLFGPFWRAHALDRAMGPTVTAMTGYGGGGPIRAIVGRPHSFALGPLSIPPPVTRLSLQKAGAFATSPYAGSIGMGVLKNFTTAFSYSSQALFLTAGAPTPDRYERLGAWFGRTEDGAITILDVTQGGPAATAGLLPGDLLIALNNAPTNLFALRAALKNPAATTATLKISRAGEVKIVTAILRDLVAPPG